MDILRAWIDEDTGKERAKIYHNIDPESITIVGLEIYFAHPGSYTPGGSAANMCRIPIEGSPYITADKEQIKAYVKEHPETINAGVYVSEIKPYDKTTQQNMNLGPLPDGDINSRSHTGYKDRVERPEPQTEEESQKIKQEPPKLPDYKIGDCVIADDNPHNLRTWRLPGYLAGNPLRVIGFTKEKVVCDWDGGKPFKIPPELLRIYKEGGENHADS